MKILSLLLTVAWVSTSACAQEHVITPYQALSLSSEDIRTNATRMVRGIVTFISGLESNRFVITPEDHPARQGLVVRKGIEGAMPSLGDLVQVDGEMSIGENGVMMDGRGVNIVRAETLEEPAIAKQSDFRKGILAGRRVTLIGSVREINSEVKNLVHVSVIKLFLDNYVIIVRVAGYVDAEKLLGNPVRVTGLACCNRTPDGKLLDAWLEVSSATDIVSLEVERQTEISYWISISLCAVLVFVLMVAYWFWLIERRKRREMAVVVAERRRMAADLHDTIEQHLAGANLIAAGVLQLEDTPDDVKEAMRTLTSLLANAKAEVRSSVMNLRSDGDDQCNLAEKIGEIAHALAKTGVKTRKLLRGLPITMPAGICHDIILIIREATTNAVKHGKAKEIIFTSDPCPNGGFRLRVSNDGEPFDVNQALGPETGHYGLSGMNERALKNRLLIEWGHEGRWTYMQLESEEQK